MRVYLRRLIISLLSISLNALIMYDTALVGQGVQYQHHSMSASRQTNNQTRGTKGRTAAQAKIDSQLLYAIKQRRGDADAPTYPAAVKIDENGYTLVDISARVTGRLLKRIRSLG